MTRTLGAAPARGACLLLALLVVVTPAARAESGSAPPAAQGTCDRALQRYVAGRPAVRAAERRIAALLNAKRYRQAVPELRSAAARHEDPWAGYVLGDLHAVGLGAPRSATVAFHWYLWSARRGNPFAQRRLADAYLNGIGVKRDVARAAYWFRIGVAPAELAVSDYRLAETYASGTLAPVNRRNEKYYRVESLRVLRRLAREPNGGADYYLGIAYAYGSGVSRDRNEALGYLCQALALGYAPAATAIPELESTTR